MEWDTYTGIFIILGMLHINYSVIFNSRKLAPRNQLVMEIARATIGNFFQIFQNIRFDLINVISKMIGAIKMPPVISKALHYF